MRGHSRAETVVRADTLEHDGGVSADACRAADEDGHAAGVHPSAGAVVVRSDGEVIESVTVDIAQPSERCSELGDH